MTRSDRAMPGGGEKLEPAFGLRLAAVGVRVDALRAQERGIGWVSHILQRTVAAMLADPRTKKLLARAERIYGERRAALVEALAAHGIESWGRSGLNV